MVDFKGCEDSFILPTKFLLPIDCVSEVYVFDKQKKELRTGGDVDGCLPGGIGRIIFDKMIAHAQNNFIAQIESETGREDSFNDFLERCMKLAIYLRRIEIKPGDVIFACSPNNLNNATVFLSSLFVGAVCASADPVLSLADTTYLLSLVEPKLIFVSDDCIDIIEEAKRQANNTSSLIVLQEHKTYKNLTEILVDITEEDIHDFEPIFVEDVTTTACMLFSSGTSGLPKGTCISHDYISANVFNNSMINNVDDEVQEIVLGFSTLYWISGVFTTLNNCYYGWIKLICGKFQAEVLWDMVKKYKVNKLIMSYYHCNEALKYLETPQESVHHFLIAGGQISPDKQDYYGEMLPNAQIVNAYGMTEIGIVSANNDYKNKSSGKPVHKNQVIRIVDPESEQPLDLNTIGEIRVKHRFQMNGYYKKDSKDNWDDDGFFKTGDVGYLTPDYNLFIVDRIKEMFKYRSWHVMPAKIECHMARHECVQHCVVIGVPAAEDDNHALAVVVLKDDCSVESAALLKYANDEMDNIHQIRAGIKIVSGDDIPYTITGKINRRMLKARILSEKL